MTSGPYEGVYLWLWGVIDRVFSFICVCVYVCSSVHLFVCVAHCVLCAWWVAPVPSSAHHLFRFGHHFRNWRFYLFLYLFVITSRYSCFVCLFSQQNIVARTMLAFSPYRSIRMWRLNNKLHFILYNVTRRRCLLLDVIWPSVQNLEKYFLWAGWPWWG